MSRRLRCCCSSSAAAAAAQQRSAAQHRHQNPEVNEITYRRQRTLSIQHPDHPQNEDETMLGRSAATAARVAARSQPKGQKRTFIDYLTNYPDRVSAIVSVPSERRPLVFSVSVVPSYWILRGATHTTNGFDRLNPRWCSCCVGRAANGLSGQWEC